jgi:DNA-binding response OmpR family regulator
MVEDETKLAVLVCAAMRTAGFVTDHAARLSDARAYLAVGSYDAIVLDLGLPDGNGLELLRDLRTAGEGISVLALTARDSVDDRVRGLDAGADDYLVKPFAMIELQARLRALLRRPGAVLTARLTLGNVVFDITDRAVSVAEQPLPVPRHELLALEVLMRRAGHVVTKERLLDQLYAAGEVPPSNAVPVHIHHLRRHLADAGASVEVVTFRGLGYMLALTKERTS